MTVNGLQVSSITMKDVGNTNTSDEHMCLDCAIKLLQPIVNRAFLAQIFNMRVHMSCSWKVPNGMLQLSGRTI
jgi:hypothetical protein